MLFALECKVNLFSDARLVRVWKRSGDRFSDAIHKHDRFSGSSNMVWYGISLQGKMMLIFLTEGSSIAQTNIENVVVPHDCFNPMQDNARLHIVRSNISILQEANILVLLWPADALDFTALAKFSN